MGHRDQETGENKYVASIGKINKHCRESEIVVAPTLS